MFCFSYFSLRNALRREVDWKSWALYFHGPLSQESSIVPAMSIVLFLRVLGVEFYLDRLDLKWYKENFGHVQELVDRLTEAPEPRPYHVRKFDY